MENASRCSTLKQLKLHQFVSVMLVVLFMGVGFAYGETQNVAISPTTYTATAGQEFSLDVNYSSSDDCTATGGVVVLFYYNSSIVTFDSFSNIFPSAGGIPAPTPVDDTATNGDGDNTTDRYVKYSWLDALNNNWPGDGNTGTFRIITLNFTASTSNIGTANINPRIDVVNNPVADCSGTAEYTAGDQIGSVVTIPDTVPPTITAVTANSAAVTADSTISWKKDTDLPVSVTISDATSGNSNIAAVKYTTDDSTPNDATGESLTGVDPVDSDMVFNGSILGTAFSALSPPNVIVKVAGKDSAGNWTAPFTFNVNVIASEVSPTNSTFTVDAGPKTANGTDTYTFTIAAKKADNTAVGNVPVVLSVDGDATGLTFTQPANTDAATGETTGTLKSTKTGTFTIKATVDGILLETTRDVTFDPGAATKIKLDVTKRTISTNGTDTVTATAVVEDANGNPVTDYSGDVTFTLSGTTYAAFTGTSATATVTVTNGEPAAITAVMTSTGTAVGTNNGDFTLTASSGTLTVYDAQNAENPNITITAQDKVLQSIDVTAEGGATSVSVCDTLTLIATGTYDIGDPEPITDATWAVDPDTAGTVTDNVFTFNKPITAESVSFTATKGEISNIEPFTVTVTAAAPALGFKADAQLPTEMTVTDDPVDFAAAVEGGCEPYTYDLSAQPDGSTGTMSPEGLFTPSMNGVYTLRVTDNIGITAEHSITVNCDVDVSVTATSQIDNTITSDTAITITNGDTIDFAATLNPETANVATWSWIFGDGNTDATANNTSNRYLYDEAITTLPVTVNATLTVTSAHASNCTATYTIAVTVNPCDAVADFTASARVITAGETVTFTNAVTAPPTGVTYAWTLGDDAGTTSEDASPADPVTYTTPGVKTVVLTATGATGCSNTKTMNIYVNDALATCPLVPGFTTEPADIMVGDEVTFTDGTTDGTTGEPATGTTVSWDTNDDGNFDLAGAIVEPATVASASITFEEIVENLTIIQKVVDDTCTYYAAGEPITVTCDATATVTPPSVVIPCGSTSVNQTFTASGSPTDTYTWWIGTPETGTLICDGNDAETYPDGCVTVSQPFTVSTLTMRSFGTGGCTADKTVTITAATNCSGGGGGGGSVPSNAPQAGLSVDVTSGVAPLTVKFTDKSVGSGIPIPGFPGALAKWEWDFGDGSTSTEQNPVHEFKTPGTYTVTLKVTDNVGLYDTETLVIVVEDPGSVDPPAASFTVEPSSEGDAPFTVTLTSTASGVVDSIVWTIDGVEVGEGAESFSYTFDEPGEYQVTITVGNVNGTDSDTVTVRVTEDGKIFVANFGFTADYLDVQFSDTSQSDDEITAYEWTFGDEVGGSSTEQNPSYTYAAAGSYDVTLTIYTADDSTSKTKEVTVEEEPVQPPEGEITAGFSASPLSGHFPLTVQFTDASAADNGIDSYTWNFGDGSAASVEQNPVHVYNTAGTYSVSLTVEGPDGTDTAARENYITVTDPGTPPTEPDVYPPVNVYPANSATEVPLPGTLVLDAYSAENGNPHASTIWYVESCDGERVFHLNTTEYLTELTLPDLILSTLGGCYTWKAQFVDDQGNVSEWSAPSFFTLVNADAGDLNNNGVPDAQEVVNPPKTINGLWARILSTDADSVGVETDDCGELGWVKWISAEDMAVTSDLPAGYEFPYGFVTYKAAVNAGCDSVTVNLHLTKALPDDFIGFKYSQKDGWLDVTDLISVSDDRKVVTFVLIDGGAGDSDGVKNGWIVDPVTIGVVPEVCCEGGGGSDTCFIESASGNALAVILLALTAALSMIFIRRNER